MSATWAVGAVPKKDIKNLANGKLRECVCVLDEPKAAKKSPRLVNKKIKIPEINQNQPDW